MAEAATADNRPYPRTELCPCCERAEVDKIGPGDSWCLCPTCLLELAEEARNTPSPWALSPEDFAVPHDYAHALYVMEHPYASDDAVADTVLDIRRPGRRP